MTVRELIKELHRMPPDAEVTTEGCDCYGDVGKVTLVQSTRSAPRRVWRDRKKPAPEPEPDYVLLERGSADTL